MLYLLYLDRHQVEELLFVQGLARTLARAGADAPPCLLIHGSSERTERTEDEGADELDLTPEDRLAGSDLRRLGIAVARRAALQDVRDVDLVALEADRLQDLVEKLACAADC